MNLFLGETKSVQTVFYMEPGNQAVKLQPIGEPDHKVRRVHGAISSHRTWMKASYSELRAILDDEFYSIIFDILIHV